MGLFSNIRSHIFLLLDYSSNGSTDHIRTPCESRLRISSTRLVRVIALIRTDRTKSTSPHQPEALPGPAWPDSTGKHSTRAAKFSNSFIHDPDCFIQAILQFVYLERSSSCNFELQLWETQTGLDQRLTLKLVEPFLDGIWWDSFLGHVNSSRIGFLCA